MKGSKKIVAFDKDSGYWWEYWRGEKGLQQAIRETREYNRGLDLIDMSTTTSLEEYISSFFRRI